MSTVNVMNGVVRPTAKFQASIWGDHFLKYASSTNDSSVDNHARNQVYIELKQRTRKKLTSNTMSESEKLNFIDVIQRLGINYHFETEIEQVLQCINIYSQRMNNDYDDDDLRTCALRFRLLRQQGYNVSSNDTFMKFMDTEGEFNTSVRDDVIGMLSLLEASHLRFREENILEKAFNFTTKQFETMLLHDRDLIDLINPHLAQQVNNALNQSLLKGFIRMDARSYFSFYENCNTHDKKLLEFAKLDFNVLQRVHQKELTKLTRWWKDLDFTNKCPFARDRLVECYFCALTIYFEPKYAYGREVFTKVISFLSILDDIYDAYGTWEELVLFTDAINRWERIDSNELSEYIKYFNDALHDYMEILKNECIERKFVDGIHYLKQMVKVMANAYLEEARWLHNKYIPTLEEYMSVALITATTRFLTVTSFIGMDPILATKDAFRWAFEDPPIMKAAAVVGRIIDDIVGFKFEQEREHVASSVQCYMNQHGVSEDIAIFELKKQVTDAWKDINFELIQPTKVSRALLSRVVGLAIFMVFYRDEDGYTHPHSKAKDLADLFVNPIDV
ncbi:probable terpene synthase 2 [Impatiens glandulifera]|uniref:probable terpene synthase 2 n=1 Tax=Impatiens glandulifera TaxID=253017 RepID=UPI001FB08EDE|nr:probable terpene synthase 2 [Impatiens glandulifera]